VNPDTGLTEKGLFGTLRIDDDEAKSKVESGLYAQLSISFDEESSELFECSFVAVEAARRSIVLKQREKKMDHEQKLAALSKQHDTLLASVAAGKEIRKAACLALSENLKAGETEIQTLAEQVKTGVAKVKTAALKATFKGFIREGKLTKVEFDKIDFGKYSALSQDALDAILASYAARPVSADVIQHGQSGAKPVDVAAQTPAQLRALIKAQQKSKSTKVLAEEPAKEDDKEKEKAAAAEGDKKKDADGDKDSSEMSVADIDDAMKHLESMSPAMDKVCEYMKKMGATLKKLMEQDDDKEKKEDKEGESK